MSIKILLNPVSVLLKDINQWLEMHCMEICKGGTGKTSAGEIELFPKEGLRQH